MTGDQALRSAAEVRSYYNRPVIKPPVWKVPDVPAYLYLGGTAGAAASMALFADLTGNPALARVGRIAAAAGSTGGVVALMHDLGRPARFLNMLRVFKPTSPLSVGSWILAPFSALASGAAASDVTRIAPGLGRVVSVAAAALSPAMTSYTAVLLADTAVPAWHEVYRELPFVFAASAVSSGGAIGMIAAPPGQIAPARRMAIAGAVSELVASQRMHKRAAVTGAAFRSGKPGKILRAARALTFVGAGAAAASFMRGRTGRAAAIGSGLCLTAAAITTRYGIFEAGRASARDPEYTIRSQRQA